MEVTLVPYKGSNLASRLFFLFVNYFITTFVLQLPPIAYLPLYPFFTLIFTSFLFVSTFHFQPVICNCNSKLGLIYNLNNILGISIFESVGLS
jgi:hypothetical protein